MWSRMEELIREGLKRVKFSPSYHTINVGSSAPKRTKLFDPGSARAAIREHPIGPIGSAWEQCPENAKAQALMLSILASAVPGGVNGCHVTRVVLLEEDR
jgi:hypothetical protein